MEEVGAEAAIVAEAADRVSIVVVVTEAMDEALVVEVAMFDVPAVEVEEGPLLEPVAAEE